MSAQCRLTVSRSPYLSLSLVSDCTAIVLPCHGPSARHDTLLWPQWCIVAAPWCRHVTQRQAVVLVFATATTAASGANSPGKWLPTPKKKKSQQQENLRSTQVNSGRRKIKEFGRTRVTGKKENEKQRNKKRKRQNDTISSLRNYRHLKAEAALRTCSSADVHHQNDLRQAVAKAQKPDVMAN